MSEERLQELEIKVAYLESLHDELNEVVTQLQNENYLLKQSVLELREHIKQVSPSESGERLLSQAEDERPPHY